MSLYGFINNKIDTIIIMGQSNVEFPALQADFPSSYTGTQYGNYTQTGSFTDCVQLIYPGTGNWGLRYPLMKDLANYKSKPQFHIFAPKGGTPMAFQAAAADWNILSMAANGSVKPLSQRLIDQTFSYYNQAVTDLGNKGLEMNVIGVIFGQGASDSLNYDDAIAWSQGFSDLRMAVRNELGNSTLKFLIDQTHSNFVPTRPYITELRQAQFDCSNQSTNPTFYDVHTDIITNVNIRPLNADETHYSGAGVLIQKDQMFEIVKNWS